MESTAIDPFDRAEAVAGADPFNMASPSGKACFTDLSLHIGSIVTADTEPAGLEDCTVGIESRKAQDFLQMQAVTAHQATVPLVRALPKVEQAVNHEQIRNLVAVKELMLATKEVIHCTFNLPRQTY